MKGLHEMFMEIGMLLLPSNNAKKMPTVIQNVSNGLKIYKFSHFEFVFIHFLRIKNSFFDSFYFEL